MLRHTLIVPLGLLQDLNHNATGAAFIKLAQAPGRLPSGEKLDPAQLSKVMPQILAIDANFRAGKYDAAQFRREILTILKLTASDEEFDRAWNAMLGDLTKLSSQLAEIKKQNEHVDIIWISKTNPIHVRAICTAVGSEEKLVDVRALLLSGNPFFTSCHSLAFKNEPSETADTAFYEEIIKKQNLTENQTTLILQCTSNSPYPPVKKRDELIANSIKEWALLRGLNIIDRQPKDKVADVIMESMRRLSSATEEKVAPIFISSPAQEMIGSGLKMHSGRFWGTHSPEATLPFNEVRPNTFRRS